LLGKLKGMIDDLRNRSVNTFVLAGYGGIGVNTPAPMANINTTYQQLVDFDTNINSSPRFIGQDFNNNGLIFLVPGVWTINLKVTLTFNELNAGRQLKLRFYNVATATPGDDEFNYFVGRNQGGINLLIPITFEVPESIVGDVIGIQVGSDADTFTTVSNIGTVFEATHSSEAKFI
jgi:hypothetical protein